MNPRAREHRFRRLKEMGCIACWKEGLPNVPPEIHHLNLGGRAGQKRRGDEFTIPLCRWHHRGRTMGNRNAQLMRLLYGPSLAHDSRKFREQYGQDDALLAKVNDLIRQMDDVATGHLRGAKAVTEAQGRSDE